MSATTKVAKATTALEKALADLETAKTAEVSAVEAYDADPSKHAAALGATLARERAERIVAKRRGELATAEAELRAEQRAALAAQLVEDRAVNAAWRSNVEKHIRRIVDAEQSIADATDAIALVVIDALDVHERAVSAARALGEKTDDIEQPSVGIVRVEVRARLRDARAEQNRDDLSGTWLRSASDDWRQATMSPAEIEQIERATAEAREFDRLAAAKFRGAVAQADALHQESSK